MFSFTTYCNSVEDNGMLVWFQYKEKLLACKHFLFCFKGVLLKSLWTSLMSRGRKYVRARACWRLILLCSYRWEHHRQTALALLNRLGQLICCLAQCFFARWLASECQNKTSNCKVSAIMIPMWFTPHSPQYKIIEFVRDFLVLGS